MNEKLGEGRARTTRTFTFEVKPLVYTHSIIWGEYDDLVASTYTTEEANSVLVRPAVLEEIMGNKEELVREIGMVDILQDVGVAHEEQERADGNLIIYIFPIDKEEDNKKDIEETLSNVTAVIQGYVNLIGMRQRIRSRISGSSSIGVDITQLTGMNIDELVLHIDEVSNPDSAYDTIVHAICRLVPDEVRLNFVNCAELAKNQSMDSFRLDVCSGLDESEYLACDLFYDESRGLYGTTLGEFVTRMEDERECTLNQSMSALSTWYASVLEEFVQGIVNDTTELYPNIKIKGIGIYSPPFYNFETDTITLTCSDCAVIHKAVTLSPDLNEKWEEWKIGVTTSYDGYAAFYTMADFKRPAHSWVNAQKATLLSFLAREMGEEIAEEMDWEEFEREFEPYLKRSCNEQD